MKDLTISKERQRVAQEIHDSLGHSLTATIMHLDYIEKIMLTDSSKAHEVIKKTQGLAKTSLNQVRIAVHTLKDSSPLDKGILPAIEVMVNTIEIADKVSVKINLDERIEKLDHNMKNIIYRTVQEGLTNSIRHGGATEIEVIASIKNDSFYLKISDNGTGCENITKSDGFLGIEERVHFAKGSVSYQSNVGQGFTIVISIPMEEV